MNKNNTKHEKVTLPADRQKALKKLLSDPKDFQKVEREKKEFLLYLSYAVDNIQNIANLSPDIFKEEKIANLLDEKEDGVIYKLAHFLWLFAIEEPGRDYKEEEIRKLTKLLVVQIFALRNLFAHPDKGDIEAFHINRDLYVFLEGNLRHLSTDNAADKGRRVDKLYKLKLMNCLDASKEMEKRVYELTRRGIIFITCLALYKDEAHEFCQHLKDMYVPPKKYSPNFYFEPKFDVPEKSNVSRIKSLVDLFTFFSCRRSHKDIDLMDLDYMSFSDILGYLNKVPAEAYDYLTLDEENNRLQELKQQSEESEENKEFKYRLRRRDKERFMSFAAAYCEDFKKLSVLKFKRLDISENCGRKKYCFGKEEDNRVHMNRHYAITNGNLGFEFVPAEHYGEIHIGSLRSSIGESELKQLLFIDEKIKNANESLNDYFSAYHRILEKMLNCQDCIFNFDDYKEDFELITGLSIDKLDEETAKEISNYFPQNLTRFFTSSDNQLTTNEVFQKTTARLRSMRKTAQDFMAKAEKFQQWCQKTPEEKEALAAKQSPDSKIKRITDGELIRWVFKYFDLFLNPNEKFRQLSRGEQHKAGFKDCEYQLIHAAIGKFSLDPRGVEKLLPKMDGKAKLVKEWAEIKKGNKTLLELGYTAARKYKEYCNTAVQMRKKIGVKGFAFKTIQEEARKVGIRIGMPKNYDSLIKTILHIDMEKWQKAYNYAIRKNYENRQLQDKPPHIVSQIPFPNGFAQRIMTKERTNKGFNGFFVNDKFDFNKAIRVRMSPQIKLLNYYNAAPLIDYVKSNGTQKEGIRFYEGEYSGTMIDKIYRKIKKAEIQDILLSNFAWKYRERALGSNKELLKFSVVPPKGTTAADFFNADCTVEKTVDGRKIKIHLTTNEVAKADLGAITDKNNLKVILAMLDPSNTRQEFTLHELREALKRKQAENYRMAVEFLPKIVKFAAPVVLPQDLVYKTSEENIKMEFPYYQKQWPRLTMPEFQILVEVRNAIFHRHIDMNIEEANKILTRLIKKY